MNTEDHVLELIKYIDSKKRERKVEPHFCARGELWNIIQGAVKKLEKDGKIKIHPTTNLDLYEVL